MVVKLIDNKKKNTFYTVTGTRNYLLNINEDIDTSKLLMTINDILKNKNNISLIDISKDISEISLKD